MKPRLTVLPGVARFWAACALLAAVPPRGWGAEAAAGAVDFVRDVYPVLQRSCFECHGAQKQKGGLRLDRRADALADGTDGIVIAPGRSAASELIRRVSLPEGDEDVMPNRGRPLTASEVALLRRWIDQGAAWPDDIGPSRHWAYVKPTRPELPAVRNTGWGRNPIDRFVLSRLEQEQQAPAPEADRRQLARRLYFAVIGLPPAPAEVEQFVADARPDAYDRLVDVLLASPRFGERWARHWLDLARYADSNGFQRDGFRDVWLYRDWVIEAMNRDLPFDQFTIEQLAGDLLPGATLAQKIATGFNRCTNVNVEAGVDQEEGRVNQVLDRVNTTATVWLGTTLECAQCHDHKYDPFTQRDYYRFFAYFNNTKGETEYMYPGDTARIEFMGPYLEMPSDETRRQKFAGYRRELEQIDAQLTQLATQLLDERDDWENEARTAKNYRGKPVPSRILDLIDVTPAQRDRRQTAALIDFRLGFFPEAKALIDRREAVRKAAEPYEPDKTLVMEELPAPRETRIFKRGDFLDPAERVAAGVPGVFGDAPPGPPNRLTLARWLVSPANPLVARVTVNRWWAEVFGQPLVTTPEDFGIKGERPRHPELLDWLAVELAERGWSMKAMVRLMVTSATFRQSSVLTPKSLAADPPNALLGRGPRFQMDAEMIRDNALSVAGLLSLRTGGPAIRPFQPPNFWRAAGKVDNTYAMSPGEDRYRRGIYVVWRRSTPYPSFANFDAPSRTACVVRRSRSNTPLQALTLLNDPVYVEAAQAFARRLLVAQPDDAAFADRVRLACQLALSRPPTAREEAALRRLVDDTRRRYAAAPELARQVTASDATLPAGQCVERAAWQSVAAALLNLSETITRE